MKIQITIDGDRAQITTMPGDIKKEVVLPPDVILGNSVWTPHLLKDFGEKRLETKRYKELNVIDGEIQDGSRWIRPSGKSITWIQDISVWVN